MCKKILMVDKKVWKQIQILRLKYGFKTINDTIKALVLIAKDSDYELKGAKK